MPENPGNRGRLDPAAKARDFLYTPRPRVRPISPARKLQQIERQARSASVSAAIAGSGGASSVPIFDSLPDPTPEDVGSIIYVAGAAGQPAQGYIGVQTQNDTVIWESIFTQAFYGAATEFLDEFYTDAAWLFVGSSVLSVDGGLGHPGTYEIATGVLAGDSALLRLAATLVTGDIEKAAFIFRTPTTTSNITMRVGVANSSPSPANGVYVEKEAETNWRLVKAIGGTETRVDSGMSGLVTNNWWLFQIEDTGVSGSFLLIITDLTGAQGSFSTTVTGLNESSSVFPFFFVQTGVAATRFLRADYFWIRHHETVRS